MDTELLIGRRIEIKETPQYIADNRPAGQAAKVDLTGMTGVVLEAGEYCPPIPFAKLELDNGRKIWMPVGCLREI